MRFRFTRHYTLQEARALLPKVRKWLKSLQKNGQALKEIDYEIHQARQWGEDLGGPLVREWVRLNVLCMELLAEFQRRQIFIKDIQRGLVDFPSLLDEREIFFCWEMGEEDILFWHELEAGYAGRKAIEE